MNSPRVVALQLALPPYRQQFLDALEALGTSIVFLCGNRQFYPGVTQGVNSRLVEVVGKNYFFLRNRFVWQPNVTVRAVKAPVAIVEINPRAIHSYAILLLRRLLKKTTFGWGHAFSRGGSGKRSNVLRRFQQRLCSGLVMYTNAEASALRRYFPEKHYIVAANSMYSRAMMHVSDSRSRKDYILIGRLVEEKKPGLGVQAFISASPNLPSGSLLHVVGTGPLQPEIEDLVQQSHAEDRVVIHGELYDQLRLSELFGSSIALLAPGYVGLNVTQSLGFGVPVVYATDEPHAPEVEALDSLNSFAFEANSVEGLAACIYDSYKREERAEIDRSEISSRTRMNYSAEAMARAFSIIEEYDVS